MNENNNKSYGKRQKTSSGQSTGKRRKIYKRKNPVAERPLPRMEEGTVQGQSNEIFQGSNQTSMILRSMGDIPINRSLVQNGSEFLNENSIEFHESDICDVADHINEEEV